LVRSQTLASHDPTLFSKCLFWLAFNYFCQALRVAAITIKAKSTKGTQRLGRSDRVIDA